MGQGARGTSRRWGAGCVDARGDAFLWGQRMFQPVTQVTEVAHTPEKVRHAPATPTPGSRLFVGHMATEAVLGRGACTGNLRPGTSAARGVQQAAEQRISSCSPRQG